MNGCIGGWVDGWVDGWVFNVRNVACGGTGDSLR